MSAIVLKQLQQLPFASTVDNLMLAIAPLGASVLLGGVFNGDRSAVTHSSEAERAKVAALRFSSGASAAQLLTIAFCLQQSIMVGHSTTFAAALLSLLLSLTLAVVLQSHCALTFRPSYLPIAFLSANTLYSTIKAVSFYLVGCKTISILQFFVSVLQLGIIFQANRLHRVHFPTQSSPWSWGQEQPQRQRGSYYWSWSFLHPVPRLPKRFVVEDLPDLEWPFSTVDAYTEFNTQYSRGMARSSHNRKVLMALKPPENLSTDLQKL